RHAFVAPWPVTLQKLGYYEFKNRRLDGVECCKHPCDRPRPRIGIVRKQTGVAFGDMENDRSCLKQDEFALLISWNLTERMKRQMCRFLHCLEGNKPNSVRLSHFFKSPTHARITC